MVETSLANRGTVDYNLASLPTPSSPFPSQTSTPSSNQGGTYNTTTGVYTSPSGVQTSRPTAPSGSTIVGGSGFAYTGGGTVGGVTFPLTPQASQEAAFEARLASQKATMTPAQLSQYEHSQQILSSLAQQDIQARVARVESGSTLTAVSPFYGIQITPKNIEQVKSTYLIKSEPSISTMDVGSTISSYKPLTTSEQKQSEFLSYAYGDKTLSEKALKSVLSGISQLGKNLEYYQNLFKTSTYNEPQVRPTTFSEKVKDIVFGNPISALGQKVVPELFSLKVPFLPSLELTEADINKQLNIAYSKRVPAFFAKGGIALEELSSGVYEGLRTEPVKTALTFAAFKTLPKVLTDINSATKFGGEYGILERPIVSVPLKYGSAVALGVTTGISVLSQPTLYSGAFELGKQLGTLILPSSLGIKSGEASLGYLKSIEGVRPEFAMEKTRLELAFREFKNLELEVGKIRLERVKELPKDPIVYNIIKEFAKEKELVLGGTTSIETLGVNLRRLPRDIEFYAREQDIPKLTKELSNRLKKANKDIVLGDNKIIFKEIGGHGGINFQPLEALNLERFGGRIRVNVEGIKVADPLATAYNKVYDLFKKVGKDMPKAKSLLKENPLAYRKGSYGKEIYTRYPKDVIGALSTAEQVTRKVLKSLEGYPIPLLQEYKSLRIGYARELIKPYLSKLKYEEAPLKPFYSKEKLPNILSGIKYVRSSTLEGVRSLLIGKRGEARISLSQFEYSIDKTINKYLLSPQEPLRRIYPYAKPTILKEIYPREIKAPSLYPVAPTSKRVYPISPSTTNYPIAKPKPIPREAYPSTSYPNYPKTPILSTPIIPNKERGYNNKEVNKFLKFTSEYPKPKYKKPIVKQKDYLAYLPSFVARELNIQVKVSRARLREAALAPSDIRGILKVYG